MKPKTETATVILSLVLIAATFFIFGVSSYEKIRYGTYTISELMRSCDGIELYYNVSGYHNFFYDRMKMEEYYKNNCYNVTRTERDYSMYTPRDMYNCTRDELINHDCDDFYFYVKCLAKLYNYDCIHVLQDVYPEGTGHIYTSCFIDEKWYRLD